VVWCGVDAGSAVGKRVRTRRATAKGRRPWRHPLSRGCCAGRRVRGAVPDTEQNQRSIKTENRMQRRRSAGEAGGNRWRWQRVPSLLEQNS
jgi:hypothetical protein